MGKKWQVALIVLLSLYASWVVAYLLRHPEVFQWDFRFYYFAAKAHAAGLNPYNTQNLIKIASVAIEPTLGYAYQPITLYFFYPLLLLDFTTAYQVFLLAKIPALIFLVVIWRRWFLENANVALLLLFILLAFNNTIYADLAAGNISIYEQLFIWGALVCFLKRRLALFWLAIVLVAIFKIVPLLFLGLLFLVDDKKQAFTWFSLSLLGYAAFLGLSYLCEPALFVTFFTQGQAMLTERGVINPSSLAFIVGALNQVGNFLGRPFPPLLSQIVFVALAGLILGISFRALIAWQRGGGAHRDKVALLFACVVYTLIAPRMKNYSYILLLAPAFFMVFKADFLPARPLLLVIVLFSPHLTLPLVGPGVEKLLIYYPLFMAYLVWFLYLRYISLTSSGRLTGNGVP
ncbi:MAG: glycosyltransferase 87 family protein [Syntrophobacterales bacterium]|nr:glycosyltransferase 87 family protein [Syntrophobacterales bacterium]